jgi:hypothetical protein
VVADPLREPLSLFDVSGKVAVITGPPAAAVPLWSRPQRWIAPRIGR